MTDPAAPPPPSGGADAPAADVAAPREPLPAPLAAMLPAYLGRQRWFGAAHPPRALHVEWSRRLWVDPARGHALWWAVVSADGERYQVLVGERPGGEAAEFLNGHEAAVLGMAGDAYYYDATLDSELAMVLLGVVTAGREDAELVRPVGAEQSNTSLVYDDRLILKVFRRLGTGANLDVEVTEALQRVEFAHVATPVAVWSEAGTDLAFAQEFLCGGTEGWALALTSLRDLYSSETSLPEEAGGDFGAEARRLGRVTAEMHLALASAFGVAPGADARAGFGAVVERVADGLDAARAVLGAEALDAAGGLVEQFRRADPGPAVRLHGDYHLGQVMRTDTGWYVLDFEGEPARPPALRRQPGSPLRDVAGMLRSFQYAARSALTERTGTESDELEPRAAAWEHHNRAAFVEGYRSVAGIDDLLPAPAERGTVLAAYEIDKALYELDYERSYRPGWVGIPAAALDRLLRAPAGQRWPREAEEPDDLEAG